MFYKFTHFIILLFISLYTGLGWSQESLTEIQDFGDNPGKLKMFQYIPQDVTENSPLIVVLHGCIQSAEEIAKLSGWNKLADENKFIVVYPQQKPTNNAQNCFNWFLPEHTLKDQGEAVSIKQMIDYVLNEHRANPFKVFVTGVSAGGAMTSAMLANYPETFKAGAIMSGIPYGAATDLMSGLNAMQGKVVKSRDAWRHLVQKQNPEYEGPYPSVVIFHGVDDPAVHSVNAKEIGKQWVAVHGLDSLPYIKENATGNVDITAFYFGDKKKRYKVLQYDIALLGHALAVDPGDGPQQGGSVAKYAVDKDFHSTYWAAKFFGLVK